MSTTTKITISEFEQVLAAHEQPVTVKLTTWTKPKLLVKNRETKAPNPWAGGLLRVTTQEVVLGASYAKSVNAQRAVEGVEGEFSAQGLWKSKEFPEGAGERDSDFTVKHKGTGRRYFAVQLAEGSAVSTWNTSDGETVDFDLVKPFLSESKPGPGRQGVENQVIWRTIDLESVRQVEIDGVTYEIETPTTDAESAPDAV